MKNKIKIAVLSLSSLAIMSGALMAPAMGAFKNTFPDADQTWIQMIMSFPAIFIIIFNILTGRLSQKYNKKLLAIIGLIIYLVGGVGGYFVPSLEILLVFRAIMGIGVGMIMPLSTGLIADFFSDNERAKMMGYSAAINNLGGIVASLLGGYLASISWRYTFLAYFFALISLTLVVFFLPNIKEDNGKYSINIPKGIWKNFLFYFYIVLIFFPVPNYLSIYISDENLGSSITSGNLFLVLTFTSFLTGFVFIKIFNKFKHKSRTIAVSFMFVGLLLLILFKNVFVFGISMAFVGISITIIMPYIMHESSKLVTKENRVLALGIIGSGSFLAQFISPLLVNNVWNVIGYSGNEFPYILSIILIVPLLIYCLIKK